MDLSIITDLETERDQLRSRNAELEAEVARLEEIIKNWDTEDSDG